MRKILFAVTILCLIINVSAWAECRETGKKVNKDGYTSTTIVCTKGRFTDINSRKAMDRMSVEKPEIYVKAQKIIGIIQNSNKQDAEPELIKMGVSGYSVSHPLLLTSEPPKSRVSFEVDGERFEGNIAVYTQIGDFIQLNIE